MYFVSIKKAACSLATYNVDARGSIKYLVGLSLLGSSSFFSFLKTANPSILAYLDLGLVILSATLLYFLLRQCHNLNTSADGKDFLTRYFVFSFIVNFRILLLYIPLYLLAKTGILILEMVSVRTDRHDMLARILLFDAIFLKPILTIIFLVVWYVMIYRAFEQLRRIMKERSQPCP